MSISSFSEKQKDIEIKPALFRSLQVFLLEILGLNFTGKQKQELLKKISDAAKQFGFDDVEKFINWVTTVNLTYTDLEKLASFLTIGETYFMREPKAYNFLRTKFIPELIKKKRNNKKIRVWSAGCASGEEAYSLAILLTQNIIDYRNWDIKVYGTDINPNFLEKARKGVYTKWSFRNCSEGFKSTFFEKENNNHRIKDFYKKLVDFKSLNLMSSETDNILENNEKFDIILCRNVMIYFSQENIDKVADKFYSLLNEEGILLVAMVEMSTLNDSKFNKITEDGLTRFIKTDLPQKTKLIQKDIILTKKWIDRRKAVRPDIVKKIGFDRRLQEARRKVIPIPKIVKPSAVKELSTKEKFELSQKLYNEGDFETSKELLKDLHLNSDYNMYEVLHLLIKSEANVGNYEIALKLCDQALIKYNMKPTLYYLFATICLELGMEQEAQKNLRKTIYLDPDFALAHYMLGKLLEKKGSTESSHKEYKITSRILDKLQPEDILLESDGISRGEFKNMTGL